MMRTTTDERTRTQEQDADWLHELLADVQKEIATQPKGYLIARMRARLLAAMDRPVRAAA